MYTCSRNSHAPKTLETRLPGRGRVERRPSRVSNSAFTNRLSDLNLESSGRPARCNWVRDLTGWPGVSILSLGETASLICNLQLGAATRTIVWNILVCWWDAKQSSNVSTAFLLSLRIRRDPWHATVDRLPLPCTGVTRYEQTDTLANTVGITTQNWPTAWQGAGAVRPEEAAEQGKTRGRYHGGRRLSSDDSLYSPTVIPPSALDKPSIMVRLANVQSHLTSSFSMIPAPEHHTTISPQLGRAEVLRGLRNFLNKERPPHYRAARLQERERESDRRNNHRDW